MNTGNYTVKVNVTLDTKKLNDQLASIGAKKGSGSDKAGTKMGDSMADNFVRAFKRKLSYGALNVVSNVAKDAVRGMIANTISLDKSQVELAKVTDLSGKSMEEFTNKAFEAGQAVAKTGQQMIDASTEFAKSGFSSSEALQLSEVATMYQNIADEEISAGEAANFIVSQMKAFDMSSVEDAYHIIDAVNNVSNNTAVSSADIANNLGKASSAAKNAGMSYEELISIMTGMTEINRNASVSARSIKTLSSRFSQIIDESSSTGQKLSDFYDSIGVEYIDKTSGQLKSFYDVLDQMGDKWGTLTKNQRNYYSLIQGGANQSQQLTAVLDNWAGAEKALGLAMDADNSAMEENKKVLDSVEGKINKLKSALQKLSHDFMSSDLLKGGLDVVTKLIEGLDKLISAGNGLAKFPVLIGAIVGGFRIFGGVLAGTGRQFDGLSKIIDGVMKLLLGKRGFDVFTNGANSMTKAIEGTGKAGKIAGKEIKKAVEDASVETVSLGTRISTTFKGAGEWIAKNKVLLGELGVAAGVLAVIFGAIEIDKYFSMESSMKRLEDYEDKAKEVQSKIADLEAKKKDSGLTKKEERELELLKLQNKELERQIELEKRRAEKGADKILKNGSGKMGGEKAGTENSAKYQTATDEYVNAEKELDKWTAKLKAANKEKEEFEQGKRTSYSESAIKEAELAVEHYQNVMDKAGDKQAEYATKTYDEWKQIMDAGDDYASLVEKFGIDSKEVANYQAIRKAVATMTIDADKLKDSYGEVEGAVEGGFELFKGGITVDDVDLSNVTDSVGAIQELLDNTVQNQTIEFDAEDKTGKVIGNIKAEVQDLTAEQWYAVVEARETGDWSEIKKWEQDPNLQGYINFDVDSKKPDEKKKEFEKPINSKVDFDYDKASYNKVKGKENELSGWKEFEIKFNESGYESLRRKVDNIKNATPKGGGQYSFKFATGKRKGQKGGLAWLGDQATSSSSPRPELVVTKDGAYLAGTTGWELHEISDQDTVYSYAETKKLLGRNPKNSGGFMMPRYAKGKKSASQKKKEKKRAEFEKKLESLEYKRDIYHWSDATFKSKYDALYKKYKKYLTIDQKHSHGRSNAEYWHDNGVEEANRRIEAVSENGDVDYALDKIKKLRDAKRISAKEAKELRAEVYKNELDYYAREYSKGKGNYEDMYKIAKNYWAKVGEDTKEYYESLDVLRQAEQERLEKKQETYSDELEYGKAYVDYEIKQLEKQKEIVEKQKEQKEDAEELVDLQNELSKARSTMVRTYKEGVGWVYEADAKAIRDAQKNLDAYMDEHKTDSIQNQIDAWQQIADLFDDIAEQSELFALAQKLGVNNLYDLVKGDITDVETMANWIKGNNTWINAYDDMMTQLENMSPEEYKEYAEKGITDAMMNAEYDKFNFGNVLAGTLNSGDLSTLFGNTSNEAYIKSVVDNIIKASSYVGMNKGEAQGKASESMSTTFNIDNISLPSVTDAKSFENSLKLYATQHSYAKA